MLGGIVRVSNVQHVVSGGVGSIRRGRVSCDGLSHVSRRVVVGRRFAHLSLSRARIVCHLVFLCAPRASSWPVDYSAIQFTVYIMTSNPDTANSNFGSRRRQTRELSVCHSHTRTFILIFNIFESCS